LITKYGVCKFDIETSTSDDLKDIEILKESYSLLDLSKMDVDPGSFPAVFISKDDIRAAVTGGSVDDMENIDEELDKEIEFLTNDEMRRICELMQDAYVETGYWDDLKYIFEERGDHER
jgi:hypothetical protein